MTWATIWGALRRAWAAVRGVPAWVWAAVLLALGVLEVTRTRAALRAERQARAIERAEAVAARRAAEREALAQGRRIDARDVATRVHDAARERIAQDSADIGQAAARGNEALADEVNRTFGGTP